MISRSQFKARFPSLFVAGGLGLAGSALLFAMLGQLDIILAPWYCDTSKQWMFPFPFIFNEPISSLLGWEIIYGLIVAAFVLVAVSFYMLGVEKATHTKDC